MLLLRFVIVHEITLFIGLYAENLKKSKHIVINHFFIFKQCKQDEVLIIIDPTKTYGANFLLCLNGESKYHYLQSEEDGNMQLVENYERDDYEYIPPVPGEWRGMASDIEIERDWVTDTRPKVSLINNNIQMSII